VRTLAGPMFASPEAAASDITATIGLATVGLAGFGADSIESCYPYGEFIRTTASRSE
jgi:hypothetical protein